ncbi:MAG: HPr family phosphocarrier protein [Chlamydiales bacterium]|nr:HPr family phosphocarrier protein [Chlamydiia bacterium]MCP5508184.1 HPr family phosphocarrier protein [Chlamydiales bacterium]
MVPKPVVNKKTESLTVKGAFVVINDRGLHTRPSTEIVKCATSYKADIRLIHKRTEVNARSLLGILMLAAEKGSKIRIVATGNDAQEAVIALQQLAAESFNIQY